jgi:integration host factor subunit beta
VKTTKRDIAREVAERSALTQVQAQDAVQFTLEAIARAVLRDGRLELRNFGVFEIKERAARKARDPRTGATMDVPARRAIQFRAGRGLREQVERTDT